MAKTIGKKKVKIDEFDKVLEAALEEYGGYISDTVVKQAIHKTAQETAEEIKKNAPRKTGDYAAAITSGYPKTKKDQYSETVYTQSPEYRLSHLLEKGHAKRNGGRVSAKPHWAKGENGIPSRLIKNIENLL